MTRRLQQPTEDEGLQGYYDNPARVDENYERHFDRLALIGAATKIPGLILIGLKTKVALPIDGSPMKVTTTKNSLRRRTQPLRRSRSALPRREI